MSPFFLKGHSFEQAEVEISVNICGRGSTRAHHDIRELSRLSLHFLNAFQEGLLLAIFPEVAPGIETGSK